MNIGIFTDVYHPNINGVVTSIKMLEKEMKKHGHNVYVFSPTSHTAPNEETELYMLKSMPLIFTPKKMGYRLATFYSRPLAKEIKELNLDIIHTHSEFSIPLFGKIISRKYNIPFIHTYHTLWEEYMHYIIPKIKFTRNIYPRRFARMFSKSFMRKAECIIVPSKKTEKYLKYKCKVKNKPMYLIPTGIDIKPFNPDNFSKEDVNNLKNEVGIKKDDKVLLFLGRVAEEKSIDRIINLMPKILKKEQNVKLVIVGDGPAKDDLESLAKSLNIYENVIFTGKVPWEQVCKYYSIGDIFINASLSETQGLTFIEAMAAKLPIVAMYAPNIAEFIKTNHNGMLAKNDNDFVNYIFKILKDNKFKEKIIKNGYKTATENSSEVFGEKLIEVYTQVINNYEMKQKEQDKNKQKKLEKESIFNLRKRLKTLSRKIGLK